MNTMSESKARGQALGRFVCVWSRSKTKVYEWNQTKSQTRALGLWGPVRFEYKKRLWCSARRVCVYPSAASFRKTAPAASARYCRRFKWNFTQLSSELFFWYIKLFDVRWLFLLCRLFSFNMRLASSSAIKLPSFWYIYRERAAALNYPKSALFRQLCERS